MADFNYVPVFYDWIEVTEALGYAEKGRLIDAIVTYARGGDPAPLLLTNEIILFPSFRAAIDRARQRDAEMSKKRSEWGKKGSQAKKEKAGQGSPESDQPKQHYNNNNDNQNNNNNNNDNDNEGVTADVRPVGPVERAKRIGNETIL